VNGNGIMVAAPIVLVMRRIVLATVRSRCMTDARLRRSTGNNFTLTGVGGLALATGPGLISDLGKARFAA